MRYALFPMLALSTGLHLAAIYLLPASPSKTHHAHVYLVHASLQATARNKGGDKIQQLTMPASLATALGEENNLSFQPKTDTDSLEEELLQPSGESAHQTVAALDWSILGPEAHYFESAEVDRVAEFLSLFEPELVLAADADATGIIVLALAIDSSGKVVSVAVEKSIDPDERIQRLFVPYLQKSTFIPALKDGIAVNSYKRIEISVTLS